MTDKIKDKRKAVEFWTELGFTQSQCMTMNEEENTTFDVIDILTEYGEEHSKQIKTDAFLKVNAALMSELGKDTSDEVKAFAKKIERAIMDNIKDVDEAFFNDIAIDRE